MRDELRTVASESASSRKRMMPPTPQQFSLSSTDESQWQADLEAQRSIWSARERRVIAAMEMFLDESDVLKVETKALELLLDPEDREVNLRYILTNASRRRQQDCRDFSTKEKIDHFVASRNCWLRSTKEKGIAQQERWLSDLQDVNYGRNDGKGSSVPPKKDEDAAGAAEFFVNKGGRKPVEFCGR